MTDNETWYATPESILTDRQLYEQSQGAFNRVVKEVDAALAVIEQVRELAEDIIEFAHCGYLGKDILEIVGGRND